MVRKLKVGVFKFTCCSGCQIEILEQADKFLKLLDRVEFEYMKILKKGKIRNFDVAFIEGCVSTKEEVELVKKIRKHSRYLIALGSCAILGGISALQNYVAEKQGYTINKKALPLKEYVKVDYNLRGCPIIGEEFIRVVKDLLAGKTLREVEYPVCYECRKNNSNCLIERGKFCAGPITYFGCKAVCPESNSPCIGCRGITKDANLKEWLKEMKDKGFKGEAKEILRVFNQFNNES